MMNLKKYRKTIISILLAGVMILGVSLPTMKTSATPADASSSMSVIAVKDGEVIESKNEDVLYDIGNASTLFIWISLMKLKEEGKLELDQNVLNYLPEEFSEKGKIKYDITILNLMNQTAGFQQVYLGRNRLSTEAEKPLKDSLLNTIPKQVYAPDAFVAYSDWGNALAALIVENVSGETYPDYVHKNILDPLGMDHTAVASDYSDCEEVAKQIILKDELVSVFYPGTSAISTANDFSLLLDDLTGEKSKILSKESVDELFTDTLKYRDKEHVRFAHGLHVYHEYADPVYGFQSFKNPDCAEILISEDRNSYVFCAIDDAGLEKDFYDYPYTVFGERENPADTTYKHTLSETAGTYIKADTVYKGVGRFTSMFDTIKLVKIDDYTLAKTPNTSRPFYTQISENAFKDANGSVGFFYISDELDSILQLPDRDVLPYGSLSVTAKLALLVALYLGMIFSFFVLLISFIRFIARLIRKGEKQKRKFRKYQYIQCANSIFHGIIFHYMALAFMMGSASSIAKTAVYINYICSLVAFIYIVFFVRSGLKEDCDTKERATYYVTAIFALTQILFSVFYGLVMFS